jgi:23S rRNA (uracil1939-C5)-methyltransferase
VAADDALIAVRVLRLAPGGDSVGHQEGGEAHGRSTFVALAAPGERILARVMRQKARVAWAELVEVLEPSPRRVPPPCPLFGRCGGCQWQHVDLDSQRAAKQQIVARAIGLPGVPLIAPVANGEGYRDRARLVVGRAGEIGFHGRRSHLVVDVRQCLLLAPALGAVLAGIRDTAFQPSPGTQIDLQAGNDGAHVVLRLPGTARQVPGGSEAFFIHLRAHGVSGIRVIAAEQTRSFGVADVDIAGPNESPLRIPAGSFAQVGRAANAALTQLVLREVGDDPGAVLELHAGSGNFTRHLTQRSARVVACDTDAAAVARGRRHAPAAVWVDRAAPPDEFQPDVVLLDPPRQGLDAANLTAALRARRRIVYVSCDPQTLGRDAARLARAGFVLDRAVALDLMPHTFHVEIVAVFERRAASTVASGIDGSQVVGSIRR